MLGLGFTTLQPGTPWAGSPGSDSEGTSGVQVFRFPDMLWVSAVSSEVLPDPSIGSQCQPQPVLLQQLDPMGSGHAMTSAYGHSGAGAILPR